jgi:hypothetical protein
MSETRAYTDRQFALAVCLAAVLGWAVILALATFTSAAQSATISATLGFLLWAAIIGLPIAFISCWVVAGPILWRVMARPIDWRRAAVWSLVVPTAMAIAGVILGRLFGLFFLYLNPSASSESYGPPGVPIEIDGILMPYGWWLTAQSSVIFVGIGFVVAMIVRAVIGPGAKQVVGVGEKTAAE